eukprot:2982847-Rhodomonas_salina.2
MQEQGRVSGFMSNASSTQARALCTHASIHLRAKYCANQLTPPSDPLDILLETLAGRALASVSEQSIDLLQQRPGRSTTRVKTRHLTASLQHDKGDATRPCRRGLPQAAHPAATRPLCNPACQYAVRQQKRKENYTTTHKNTHVACTR